MKRYIKSDSAESPITEGMIVKFKPEWCSEGERKCRMVVLESYPDVHRCLVQHLNTGVFLPPTEVVDFDMIQYTGIMVDENTLIGQE